MSTVWGWELLRSENADDMNYYNEIVPQVASAFIRAALTP